MAKITRIKATDSKNASKKASEAVSGKKQVKVPQDSQKAKKPQEKPKKAVKKPFVLFRPFVYFGRYIRDSWQETRQVRWPSRKATWKLFFAILIYTFLFVAIIMLLDALFSWLFNLIIG